MYRLTVENEWGVDVTEFTTKDAAVQAFDAMSNNEDNEPVTFVSLVEVN